MTRPAARVLTLLELLQSGGVRTVTELAGPFVIERPDELRGLVIALADRLAASARGR